MLIRLAEVIKSMNVSQASLLQIKNSKINVESHSDLEHSLRELANASTRTRDANKILLDLSYRYCQVHILNGGYGRIVHIQPLYQQKGMHLEQMK